MDCPDCGTALVTYRFADREASVCERCGHVGIDAEHRPGRRRVESWATALDRFYRAAADGSDTSAGGETRLADETATENAPSRETKSTPTPTPVPFDGQSAVRQSSRSE